MDEQPEVLTTTEARSGTGTHVLRYMLIASVILAVAAMVWVFFLAPTATQPDASVTSDTATSTR